VFRPQSRRAFLGNMARIGAVTGAAALASRLALPGSVHGQDELDLESVKVLIADTTHERADIRAASASAESVWRESALVEAPFAFTHLGLHWRGAGQLGVEVRTRAGGDWSSWRRVIPDGSSDDNPRGEQFARLLGTDRHVLAQYRLPADRTPPERLTLTFLNSQDGPRIPIGRALPPTPQIKGVDLRADIITREEWGADESIRFSEEGEELWPRAYVPPRMMVVHHTATSVLDPDPAADIRSIYAFHTITRGWGDIGYNALIDGEGRMYEGRRGRDIDPYGRLQRDVMSFGVVGAHASGYNYGSASVSLLGDFQVEEPPDVMWQTLEELLVFQHRRFEIDPRTTNDFARSTDVWRFALPALCGHRDCGGFTECPGDFVYRRLPALRQRVAERIVGGAPTRRDAIEPRTVRNVWPGATTFHWQGAAPYDVVLEGFWKYPDADPVDYLAGYDASAMPMHGETWETAVTVTLAEVGQYTLHVRPAGQAFTDRVTVLVERQAVRDNGDDEGVERTGTWARSRTIPEMYGLDYEQADADSGSAFVWRLTAPESGTYRVQATWATGTDRTRDASYTVMRNGAQVGTMAVDQSIRGGRWNELGLVDFAEGDTCEIRLTAHGEPGQIVVADAVRIVLT
jgi:hypothetical protein